MRVRVRRGEQVFTTSVEQAHRHVVFDGLSIDENDIAVYEAWRASKADVYLCGAETSDGTPCAMQVDGPGERCRYHEEDA